MGCFSDSEELKVSVGLRPSKERSCTDILFLLLFVAFWGATIYVAQRAIASGGDPNRVIRGVDLYGRVCGKDSGVEDKPYAAWPYPPEYTAQVCLASCALTSSDSQITVPHSSTRLVWYCIPDVATRDPSFEAISQKFNWALGDLYTAWPVILGSVAVALAFSFLYILFCRKFAGALVWTVIFGLMAGGLMLAGALLRSAYTSDSSVDAERVQAMYGLGGVVLALTLIFAILVFGLRKRIAIAVEVVREASRALSAMLTLPFFPILPMLYTVAYFAFWIIVALYLYSVASKASKDTPSGVTAGANNPNPTTQIYYDRDTTFNNIIIGHFFGLLWNVQFVIYFAYLVMAGAVADWYFHPRDGAVELQPRAKVVPLAGEAWAESGNPASRAPVEKVEPLAPRSSTPVWDSVKRTTRFHLGTVAFGSLIIAIINFIRAVVTYIEAKTRNRNNRLQKILFCMLQCFLSCLHCCADKISKNAFIWTAIWGDSFVPATCSSFKLLWQNLARVAAINLVGAYLLFLGKVIVATCTAGVAALVLSQVTTFKEELSSILLPSFAVFLLAFAVASLFLNVYETTIDTIFLCFLVDAEYNKSAAMFASKELQELVGKHAAESKKLAEEAVALPEH